MQSRAKDSGYLHGWFAETETFQDNPFIPNSLEAKEWMEGFFEAQADTLLKWDDEVYSEEEFIESCIQA